VDTVGEQREEPPPFRADHVGSLLRPKSLLELRERRDPADAGAAARLRAHEDECIAAVVARQEAVGLEGVTDGEFRRESFHGDFLSRLENVEFKLLDPGGRRGGAPFVAVVSGKIGRPAGGIEVENFRYLKSVTHRTAKQTLPSPTMAHFRGGREAIDRASYPEMPEFFADLARVYREEIADLAAAGCRYLQLDDTNLAYLCDATMRARAAERGEDVARLPHDYATLINESIRGRPEGLSVCVHLCRGNARSRWFARGGYEPVAEVVFNELDVDGFFLEYDDERSGDFSPLRFVPPGKRVVLGLVTSKRGELESADAVRRRIDEAAGYVDIGRLCLSPQCGFASAAAGNLLSEDEQWRKLERIVEVAAEVWG
jgi:5-methyltetrahydropteroyltriglutamate--homocysteine methyltransferase